MAADPLSYSGSATLAMSILYGGAFKAFEARTGKRFTYIDTISGTPQALSLLSEDKVTLAGAGRFLSDKEKAKGLVENTIALDALAIWVNRINPVANLTRAQARDIFTGKITHWKKIGGLDIPIALALENPASGKATMEVTQKILLENGPFGPPTSLHEFGRDMIIAVSQNPGAVCVASQGLQSSISRELLDQVRMVALDGVMPTPPNILSGAYPLTRPLILVTAGKPAGEAKAFIDFMLSPEGQRIVAVNFVPVARID